MKTEKALAMLAWSLLLGCSMRKQVAQERVAVHVGEEITNSMESRHQRLEQETIGSIWLENAITVAEIIPRGIFRLNTDSGFIGEAQRVVIGQKIQRGQSVETNTTVSDAGEELVIEAQRGYTGIQQDAAASRRDLETATPLNVPWWGWLCGISMIAYALWYGLKK